MATPPKVPREELETVSGFIHSVSPIRITTNNTQMFNAVLQTDREEYHDVVVFSASKRQAFLQAAQNGTPMSLSQVRKTLSFKGTSDFDVVVNYRADLTVTSLPFVCREPTGQSKSPLREVTTLPSGRKVNLVEAKVLSITPTTRTIAIRGTDRELQECLISDGTDETTLQLWEHHVNAVQMLSSYRFTDLSTRVFKGKVQLTTTLTTAVEKIPDLRVSDTAVTTTEPAVVSVSGSVYGMEIRAVMKCSICSIKQDKLDPRTVFHRCQSCNMKQKTATFTKLLSGMLRIQAENEKHALTVSNAALVTYLERYNLKHLTLTDEIEEHFLALETLSVTFDSDMRVAEITQPPPLVQQDPISPQDPISEADQHAPAKSAPKEPTCTKSSKATRQKAPTDKNAS